MLLPYDATTRCICLLPVLLLCDVLAVMMPILLLPMLMLGTRT